MADGIAIIKDEWMDNVFDEFDEYEKKNSVPGKIYFKDFTDSLAIINSSMMVTFHESDSSPITITGLNSTKKQERSHPFVHNCKLR